MAGVDLSSLSPSQMQVAISTGKAPDGSSISLSDMQKISDELQKSLNGSNKTSDTTYLGLGIEKTLPQVTNTPQSVSRWELGKFADANKDTIFKDPASGKYYIKGSDGKNHEVTSYETATIGAKWTSRGDASAASANKEVTENTCLDNVVSNYNKTRKEGTRELTREDVVACNPEVFGTEAQNKRKVSEDGVANLFQGDKLKLPVVSEEELPPPPPPPPPPEDKGKTEGADPLPDPGAAPKDVKTVHFSNGKIGPNVSNTDLENDNPLFNLADKYSYSTGVTEAATGKVTREMDMQAILSKLEIASGGSKIVTYQQISDLIKKNEDYTKSGYDYKLPDSYKNKAIDLEKLKDSLGFAEVGDFRKGKGAFSMDDCTISTE